MTDPHRPLDGTEPTSRRKADPAGVAGRQAGAAPVAAFGGDTGARAGKRLPSAPTLPAWVAMPLGRVPRRLSDPLVILMLNRVFAPVIARGDLALLEGRHLALEVSDLGQVLTLSLRSGSLRATHAPADATISARGYDFLQLAAGLADPDTLFFQRRLKLSGDTELALAVKNLLGSLDPASLLPAPLYGLLLRSATLARRWCGPRP